MGIANWSHAPAFQASKTNIANDFGRARATYEQAARLQRRMGQTLLDWLDRQPLFRPDRVLDLGCGTGRFSRALLCRHPNAAITGVDLSPGMIAQARDSSPEAMDWITADAESLPFRPGQFDLIFSNLMIQWCERPERVLAQCRQLLRPGGALAISTLLDGTLWELKQAWAEADPGQPHVNRFETRPHWQEILAQELPDAELVTETIALPYDSPMALNRELKQLGAGFKGQGRRRTVTSPGRFRRMAESYPRASDGQVLATYQAAYIYYRAEG